MFYVGGGGGGVVIRRKYSIFVCMLVIRKNIDNVYVFMYVV